MVHSKSFYGAQLQRGKRLGTRWASRTSNPVSGSRQAGGGFDSHTLPPREGQRGNGDAGAQGTRRRRAARAPALDVRSGDRGGGGDRADPPRGRGFGAR